MGGGTTEQFGTALDSLLAGLKASSNPHIFITSHIIGSDADVDAIKRQACAADPSHRIFVDLNGRVNLSGEAGHPNDAGMKTISNALFDAMVVQSVPEPSSIVLLVIAGISCGWTGLATIAIDRVRSGGEPMTNTWKAPLMAALLLGAITLATRSRRPLPQPPNQWTLATADTSLTIGLDGQGKPAIVELKNPIQQFNWTQQQSSNSFVAERRPERPDGGDELAIPGRHDRRRRMEPR